MNQEIAARSSAGGRQAILDRADALADTDREHLARPGRQSPRSRDRSRMGADGPGRRRTPARRVDDLRDLAALIGSHPVPVGMRIANHPIDNGHRVLQAGGTVSPGFRWYEPDRTDDPVEVLESRGRRVRWCRGAPTLPSGSPSTTWPTFSGRTTTSAGRCSSSPRARTKPCATRSSRQLTEGTTPARLRPILVRHLRRGRLSAGPFSTGRPRRPPLSHPQGGRTDSSGPGDLSDRTRRGGFSASFSSRPPFDAISLREEFRVKLNQIAGIEISTAKLALRPNIRAELLTSDVALQKLVEHFSWFIDRVQEGESSAWQDD